MQALAAVDLRVVGRGGRMHGGEAHRVVALQRIHLRHQLGQVAGDHEVLAVAGHLVVKPSIAEDQVAQEGELLLVADRGVVLGAGYREFLQRDAPVHQLPGILPFLGADPGHQVARVEAGDQRHRSDALAAPVEPQRRAWRHQREAVAGFPRPRMMHAGGVIPHRVEMGEIAAGRTDGVMQPAVGVAVRAVEDHRRRRAPVAMPVLAHALDVAVEAARRDDHATCGQLEYFAILLADTAAAGDSAIRGHQLLDALAAADFQIGAARMLFQGVDQAQRQFASGAPDDMEARHRIARCVQAALDPVRGRQEADAAAA